MFLSTDRKQLAAARSNQTIAWVLSTPFLFRPSQEPCRARVKTTLTESHLISICPNHAEPKMSNLCLNKTRHWQNTRKWIRRPITLPHSNIALDCDFFECWAQFHRKPSLRQIIYLSTLYNTKFHFTLPFFILNLKDKKSIHHFKVIIWRV
jgi:hypothetical protein